jgi:hypothetical protein
MLGPDIDMKTHELFRSGSRTFSAALAGALLASCASAGTRPSDMTAARHQAAAASAETEGGRHDRQYDPAAIAQAPCAPSQREACSTPTSYWNPTEGHSQEGAQYQELAAKHRAASQALETAEARACGGVPVAERGESPFRARGQIERVDAIKKEVAVGSGGLRGARLVLRPRPGMSAERLQRAIDCHLARWAATGAGDPAVAHCPLALKGVRAQVKPSGDGLAVEITANDEQTAATVMANARALLADAGGAGGP